MEGVIENDVVILLDDLHIQWDNKAVVRVYLISIFRISYLNMSIHITSIIGKKKL